MGSMILLPGSASSPIISYKNAPAMPPSKPPSRPRAAWRHRPGRSRKPARPRRRQPPREGRARAARGHLNRHVPGVRVAGPGRERDCGQGGSGSRGARPEPGPATPPSAPARQLVATARPPGPTPAPPRRPSVPWPEPRSGFRGVPLCGPGIRNVGPHAASPSLSV